MGRDNGTVKLPFPTLTAQETGRRMEAKLLKERGAMAHPMSGAGSVKHDGSDAETLYEVKHAKRSHKLSGEYLRSFWKAAVGQGKDPVLLVHFADADVTLECRVLPGLSPYGTEDA